MIRWRILAGVLALAWVACAPALSAAQTTVTSPVAGRLELRIEHAHGFPPFALTGERLAVRGIVAPFVAGQTVRISFYLDGRLAGKRTVRVTPAVNGEGEFVLGYSTSRRGVLTVKGVHAASAEMTAFSSSSQRVRFVASDLARGTSGAAVRLLQSGLAALHYSVSRGGVFDEATANAVVAYRKLTGLARVPSANIHVFRLLARGAGRFRVRYPGDGKHVEADLARQVLAEIDPGGRVHRIYTMSSGKPSTPTVSGRFRVYLKAPGTNAEGMVDSNYFLRGFAIHGYAEVPSYAASHGCLRVPIADAAAIYAWVSLGTRVDVS